MVDPPATEEELLHYANLLAQILESKDNRDDVEQAAVHVWRIELTIEQHERLQQFNLEPLEDEEEED